MPLVGDLKQTTSARLLGMLAAGRKTGVLKVKSGKATLTAHFRAGRLQRAWLSEWPEPVDALVAECAPPEHREAAKALAHGSDLGAALWLGFARYADSEQILARAREKGRDALRMAATWQKGELRYEDGPGLSPGELDLNLRLTPLVNHIAKGA